MGWALDLPHVEPALSPTVALPVAYLWMAPQPLSAPSPAETQVRPPAERDHRPIWSAPQSVSPVPMEPPAAILIDRHPPLDAHATPTPSTSASAPLKLDAATLRAAHQAAKSEVRKMAEASGRHLDDPAPTAAERLQAGIAQATKPECLGAGGSLLQAALIAYWVATDKCRVR